MTILELPDQPLQVARPVNRSRFAAGVVVSLCLHALAALLLIGGFEGHAPTKPVETVEVEIVQLPPPPVEPPPAEEEPPAEEQEAPPPAPEEDAIEQQAPETPVTVIPPVTEFGEEDTVAEDGEEGAPQQAISEPTEESGSEAEVDASETELPQSDEEAPEETPEETSDDTSEDTSSDEEVADVEEEPVEQQETQSDEEAEAPPSGQTSTTEEVSEETPVQPGPSEDVIEEPVVEEQPEETISDDPDSSSENSGEGQQIVTATPRAKPPAPPRSSRASRPSDPASNSSSNITAQLRPARRILTGDVLVDSRTRTAMRGMSPRQRLIHLCTAELRAQLNAATPPYYPDQIPFPRTPGARTILETRSWVALPSYGNWFKLAYRCETDRDVRRISRISFKVGGPIPRLQWRQYGIPTN